MTGSQMKPTRIESGTDIFREGDHGDRMYIVSEGVVELSVKGKVIATVSKGGIFGEMALIDDKPRSATARAKTDCEFATIDEAKFFELVHEKPSFALEVMKVLVERLRMMDTRP
jgi:CRP-like cAMP-binding protein